MLLVQVVKGISKLKDFGGKVFGDVVSGVTSKLENFGSKVFNDGVGGVTSKPNFRGKIFEDGEEVN